MYCNLIWEDEEKRIVRCTVCNRTRETRITELSKIGYLCQKAEEGKSILALPVPPAPPPLVQRLKNFSVAAISHVTAGHPTCTQEQVDERYAICRECPLFINHGNMKGICSHSSCGCNITNTLVFLNKLGWADQSCPIGKWGPIVQNSDGE